MHFKKQKRTKTTRTDNNCQKRTKMDSDLDGQKQTELTETDRNKPKKT